MAETAPKKVQYGTPRSLAHEDAYADVGTSTPRKLGPESLEDHPGHDAVRRQDLAGVGSRRRGRRRAYQIRVGI